MNAAAEERKNHAQRTEMVSRAAVARFLKKEPEEVDWLAEMAGLPHIRVPERTRPGMRIFLPDLHQWVVQRAQGETARLKSYDDFKRAFFAAQGK